MKVFCAPFKCLQFGFVIFWWKDFGAKAAHKMLVKLTPGPYTISLLQLSLIPNCNKLELLSMSITFILIKYYGARPGAYR
jgi:hypothetical protein